MSTDFWSIICDMIQMLTPGIYVKKKKEMDKRANVSKKGLLIFIFTGIKKY